ncbi:PREDICTED: fatty acid synthase-like [Priapulus caudatus]|uniref:Fatty acid synthase n=1 Tax=Priapulus caudatus TaxID=37621 RepID=A0ABM1E612_PRICU|nr:PREDICTED: fatty acid synthase-like [Priapulus caudatus]
MSLVMQRVSCEARPVWFVCSGMGVQWPGMARDMMRVPAFKQTMLQLADTLTGHGVDLCDIIASGEEKMLESTPVAFAAIAAVQVALIDVLRSLGIYGDGFVGHSVGELACAYADGCLSAEQTVLCAYWRGKCVSEAKLPAGKMAAIGLTWEETRRRCPADIVAACHNSRDSVTISGPAASVDVFMAELRADDVFVREVASSGVAFHSHQMAQVAPKLKAALLNVIKHPKRRTAKWISTSIPESRWDSALAQLSSADYHVNNLVSPVLFQEGLTHVPDNAVVIEVASHCLLQAILRRSLNDGTTIIGLQNRREEDNTRFFLASIGKCYVSGVNPATCKLRPSAPHFPVLQGTAMLGSLISWDHSQTWAVPAQDEFIITNGMGECKFEIDLSATSPDLYLLGHVIDGRVLFPATGYLVLVWRALAKMRRQLYESMAVEFNDIDIQRATVIHADGKVTIAVNIMQATGDFQVTEGKTLVARGRITAHASLDIPEPLKLKGHGEPLPLCADDVYKEMRMRGYDYSGEFQAIVAASLDLSDAKVAWTGNWVQFVDNMMQQILTSMYTRYQQYRLAEWRNLGVKVEVSKMDASLEAQARQLIDTTQQVAPLGGIFHLAAVLRDGLFENQTAETFSEVNKPKMATAFNLDLVTRDTCATSLDWFVVFSSVSCGRGIAGQTNYGYANSTMERICERRQRDGFPALAIQWGAIGDVGVARSLGGKDAVIGGTQPQRITSCMQTMDVLLNQPFPVVSSFVLAEKHGSGGASTQDSQVDLIHAVANILGVKDVATLNAELTLGELGLDSLMGVEVRQTLERDFDLSLSMTTSAAEMRCSRRTLAARATRHEATTGRRIETC